MNRQYSAEEVLQCPYDASHKVPRDRFQRHYRECQRSHPEIILLSCPFDRSHRVPVAELDAHVRTCPTRAIFNQRNFNKPMKGRADRKR